MRRSAVALAVGAAALGVPVAAVAAPSVNPGTPSSSGWLKGPDVTLQWQATWDPAFVIAHEVRYTITPVGGGAQLSVSKGLRGPDGLGDITVRLSEGTYDISARGYELLQIPGIPLTPVLGDPSYAGRYRVDSTAPGPGSFELAGGAPYTNRFTVRARGGAASEFGGSGVGYYEIRHEGQGFPGCSRTVPSLEQDGTGCGAVTPPGRFQLLPFVDKDIILPAGPDGLRRVWIRYRDRAQVQCPLGGFGCLHDGDGNASTPIFDDIVLDTTAPTIALTAGKTVTGEAGAPVAFDAGASTDATSGIDPAGFRWDFKDGSPVVENAGPVIEHTYPGPGSYPGEVRGRDKAGNPAVFAFTAFVGVAPPAGGGEEGPLGGPGGQEPPPAANPGGGENPPAGGAGGAAPAPPGPVVVVPKPKVLKVRVDDDKAFVNVNDEGVMRVRIETLKGRKLAAFSQAVDQGRNRLRVPRRLGPKIPDTGRLVLEMQVVADGVAGPVISRRINAVALNPQPLPPKARTAPR